MSVFFCVSFISGLSGWLVGLVRCFCRMVLLGLCFLRLVIFCVVGVVMCKGFFIVFMLVCVLRSFLVLFEIF